MAPAMARFTMSDEITHLKAEEKEEVRPHHYAAAHHSTLAPGLVLILIGGIFLIVNVTGMYLQNWWALFILIPALSSFARGWQSYEKHGRLTRSARRSFVGSLFFILIATVFLLGLNWGTIWPLFLILFGIKVLASNL
jgi:hypothetical protein